MFNNPGAKLKKEANGLWIAAIIFSIIYCIVEKIKFGTALWIVGLVAVVSYLISLTLYAFGELVENSAAEIEVEYEDE